jgi:hypothetical protein
MEVLSHTKVQMRFFAPVLMALSTGSRSYSHLFALGWTTSHNSEKVTRVYEAFTRTHTIVM